MFFKVFFLNYTKPFIRLSSKIIVNQNRYVWKGPTLTRRLLQHLNRNLTKYDSPKICASTIKQRLERININSNLDICELALVNSSNSPYIQLRQFDNVVSSHFSNYSTSQILQILNIFYHIDESSTTKQRFYLMSLDYFCDHVLFATREETLKILFFTSLLKKSKHTRHVINRCLHRIEQDTLENFTVEELCIICLAAFRTSSKFQTTKILDHVINSLLENLAILNDPALTVSFVKSIRHNRRQDDNLQSTISHALIFNKSYKLYSFVSACHILALYSDNYYYDESLLDVLANQCLEELSVDKCEGKVNRHIISIRPKDITRFLWALSFLSYEFKTDCVAECIIPSIQKCINNNKYAGVEKDLLDSVFYLWLINPNNTSLIPYCFHEKYRPFISDDSKTAHRMNLLATAIKIEDIKLYEQIGYVPSGTTAYRIDEQIQKRPTLRRVFQCLKIIAPKLDANRFEFCCQIPFLNIVGITAFKKKIYKAAYIEVLDSTNVLKNSTKACGLMNLKLRLLDQMDEGLITIDESHVAALTDAELISYLEDELKLIT